MKKQMNQAEVNATINQAQKATQKKEEKKMKKAESTIIIPENLNQDMFKAYRLNEAGEMLMSQAMLDEFAEANPEVSILNQKADATLKGLAPKGTKKAFAKVRLDEEAKKKQIHNRTGATRKICSARNEADGMRYKVIFVEAKNRFELWSADNGGKRKKMAQGAEAEVMALYEKALGIKAEATPKKAPRKVTKKAQGEAKKSA